MNDKNKLELQEKYKEMDNDKLITITTVDKNDYTPEAVELARIELTSRNVDIKQQTEKANAITQEREREQKWTEEKPLTRRQKIAFTLIPVIGFYYSIFSPKEWKKRKKEATKLYILGALLWFVFRMLIVLIIKINTPQ